MKRKVLVIIFICFITIILVFLNYSETDKIVLMNEKISAWVETYSSDYKPIKTEFIDTIFMVDRVKTLLKFAISLTDKKQVNILQKQKTELLKSGNPKEIYGYIFIHDCEVRPLNQKRMLKHITFYTNRKLNIDYANIEDY